MRTRLALLACALALPGGVSGAEDRGPAASETQASIVRLEQELARAVVRRDVAALRRIEAEGYVYTDSDAKVSTREDFLASYASGASHVTRLSFRDFVVDVYESTAVVRGVLEVERRDGGVKTSRRARYTRVYVRFPEGWRAVAGHSSALATVRSSR
jgi:ketosteroid isomerase-like protein